MLEDIVGKDVETTTNEQGGSQSKVPVRFDLIDGKALFEQAKVLYEGAEKYGENNWRLIPVEDHLNHLIMHAYAYLAGDRSDEHLSHIMCRATFAQGVAIADEESFQADLQTEGPLSIYGLCMGAECSNPGKHKVKWSFVGEEQDGRVCDEHLRLIKDHNPMAVRVGDEVVTVGLENDFTGLRTQYGIKTGDQRK